MPKFIPRQREIQANHQIFWIARETFLVLNDSFLVAAIVRQGYCEVGSSWDGIRLQLNDSLV